MRTSRRPAARAAALVLCAGLATVPATALPAAAVTSPATVRSSATVTPTATAKLHTVPSTAVTGVALRKRGRSRVTRLLRKLDVRHERGRGYRRSAFGSWISRHGCDTRALVLKAESRRHTTQNRYCTVKRGKWRSEYDGKVVKRASRLDIDHRVPLAEAWRSGARRWNARTRRAYANDLRYKHSLVAVTASTNRSKSDRDPDSWLPPRGSCRYVTRWVAVKYRWRLSVDRAERRAIRHTLSHCGVSSTRIATPPRARIRKRHGGTGGGTGGGGTGGGGGTDPRFEYCYQANDAGYGPYYQGKDREYGWYEDRDHDGVVCE